MSSAEMLSKPQTQTPPDSDSGTDTPASATGTSGVPVRSQRRPRDRGGDVTVEKIIANARRAPVLAASTGACLLSLLSAVLMWASFYPLNWSWLGWFALVPMILLVRLPRPTSYMYTAIYGGGFVTMLASLQWMRLGDPSMYLAWFAMAVYVGLYFPVFVGLSRVAVHRLGLPLTLAVPVVWTGLEFFRATLITGFGWYLLGHTQHQFIELIQISDVTGVYGVSFVVATVSAAAAGLVSLRVLHRLKLLPPGYPATETPAAAARTQLRQRVAVVAAVLLFAAVVGYGFLRRDQAEFREGPRVALVQGNFETSLKHDPSARRDLFRTHYELTGLAVRFGEHPELIIWPETMYRNTLFEAGADVSDNTLRRHLPQVPTSFWRERRSQEQLSSLSNQAGAAMLIGVDTYAADENGFGRYNSAAMVQPEVGITSRYDKRHRVPFGEYVPLAETLPFLQAFTPVAADGMAKGAGPQFMRVKEWTVSPIICYEDTVPHLVRKTVRDGQRANRPVDVLVNLTNDGWFTGSSEQVQHLLTAKFRAVECRTPLVRAVNTGVSAFVDGDGVVIEPDVFLDGDAADESSLHLSMIDPETGGYRKELNAVLVHNVPLDSRSSLYVKFGDVFSGSCAVSVILLCGLGVWTRRSTPADDALKSLDSTESNS